MIKYLKGELYKFYKSKIIIWIFIITLLYSIMANVIYYIDKININILYQSFNEEYLIIYLALSLFISSSLFKEEITSGTIFYQNSKKQYISKIIFSVVFYITMLIVNLLICMFISTIFNIFLKYKIDIPIIQIFKNYINILPMIIFYNLICATISLISTKSSICIILTYLLYILNNYITNKIIFSNNKTIKYLFLIKWNPIYKNDTNHYQFFYNLEIIVIIIILLTIIYKLYCKNKIS